MTISVDAHLSPAIAPNEASRLNLTLSEYILRILSVRQVLANPPKTGAELVAYWESEGVINSRPDITAFLNLVRYVFKATGFDIQGSCVLQ